MTCQGSLYERSKHDVLKEERLRTQSSSNCTLGNNMLISFFFGPADFNFVVFHYMNIVETITIRIMYKVPMHIHIIHGWLNFDLISKNSDH